MSAHNDKLRRREEARRLYVEKGYNFREIAQVMAVAYSTVMRWAKEKDPSSGLDWKQQRIEYLKTPATARDSLMNLLKRTLEKIERSGKITVEDADSVVKIVKSIRTLEKEYDRLSVILWTMTDFSDFLRRLHKHNPKKVTADFMKTFEEILHEYTQNCLQKYGK